MGWNIGILKLPNNQKYRVRKELDLRDQISARIQGDVLSHSWRQSDRQLEIRRCSKWVSSYMMTQNCWKSYIIDARRWRSCSQSHYYSLNEISWEVLRWRYSQSWKVRLWIILFKEKLSWVYLGYWKGLKPWRWIIIELHARKSSKMVWACRDVWKSYWGNE